MVKVKTLFEFVDARHGGVHHVGDIFEADEKRVAEINSVDPYLIEVLGKVEPEGKKVKKDEV